MGKYSKCDDVQKFFNIVNKLRTQGMFRSEIHRFVDVECDLIDRLMDQNEIIVGNKVYRIVLLMMRSYLSNV